MTGGAEAGGSDCFVLNILRGRAVTLWIECVFITCIATFHSLRAGECHIVTALGYVKKSSVRVYITFHNMDGWVFVCTTIRCLPLHPRAMPSFLLL
jgi:hypothetical protein